MKFDDDRNLNLDDIRVERMAAQQKAINGVESRPHSRRERRGTKETRAFGLVYLDLVPQLVEKLSSAQWGVLWPIKWS
jgi:hypothetical protein